MLSRGGSQRRFLIDNVIGSQPIPHWLAQLPGADSRHGLLLWVVDEPRYRRHAV